MRKLLLIIQREYFSRVKKKSFVIMTLLGPILMAALFVVPVLISMQDKTEHHIRVIDQSGAFYNRFENTESLKYTYDNVSEEVAQRELKTGPYDLVLMLPYNIINNDKAVAKLYFIKQPGSATEEAVRNNIDNISFELRLAGQQIDVGKIDDARRPVRLSAKAIDDKGNISTSYTEYNIFLGFICAGIIYMMIFIYGAQVMNGVLEEKTSRIVEVLISSVKPFQLMLGKILGIALVGLTQFVLWIVFTAILSTAANTFLFKDALADKAAHNQQVEQVMKDDLAAAPHKLQQIKTSPAAIELLNYFSKVNIPLIAFTFAFYFLFGYLLYAALFAAVGSAVDSETDKQQFILPISIPLVLGFVVAQSVIMNPDGALAYWFSIIPLTSPIVMMVRLPFGVPASELITSMLMLVAGFFFFTWLAGKIYRVGILMYGKKASWKELGKWMFYRG